MIEPTILKQMKADNLTTLNLRMIQQRGLDERDWNNVANFIAASQNLREVDFSNAGADLEVLSSALIQNQSIKKLNVSRMMHEHNMPALINILQANPRITELDLSHCTNIDEYSLKNLATLQSTKMLTEIDVTNVCYDHAARQARPEKLLEALKASPNILRVIPSSIEMNTLCTNNAEAAKQLVMKVLRDTKNLTAGDIQDIQTRLPAFMKTAETGVVRDRKQMAQLFVNIEDTANALGVAFTIPQYYAEIASHLPKPFYPSADKVDFLAVGNLGPSEMYKAVEAGQVAELMAALRTSGKKITATDCLLKPEGKKENLIELVARQGALSTVMTVANWTGDPRGFKQAADAVPVREWQRQMKDMPVEQLLCLVNASSFKKARQPGMKP